MKFDKPFCDKCGESDFDVVSLDEMISNPVPASEYFLSGGTGEGVPAIMIYNHYRATCKTCGEKYEFTR